MSFVCIFFEFSRIEFGFHALKPIFFHAQEPIFHVEEKKNTDSKAGNIFEILHQKYAAKSTKIKQK